MAKVDLIIFDFDGTLVDSEPISAAALLELVPDFGLTIEEFVTLHGGRRLSEVFAIVEETTGRSLPSDFEKTFRALVAKKFDTDLTALPGVEAALNALEVPFCIGTNAPSHKAEKGLTVTGLLPYFESRIFSAYDIKAWKPDPTLFLHAARESGVAPENCMVLDDSVFGIEAGHAAGMQVIKCSHGHLEPTSGGAAFTYNDLANYVSDLNRASANLGDVA